MISDVLFEALEAIKEYQTDPVVGKCYESLKQDLGVLTTVMEGVQVLLDMPPDRSDAVRTALQDAIRKIDVSEIASVVHRISNEWSWT